LSLGNVKVIFLLLDFVFLQVEVIFVDFGNTETVNPSELVSLDTLKKSVAEFPHQVSSYTELPENIIYTTFTQT
jgi:Tudor domain.